MSQPTYDRILEQLDRLGLRQIKESLAQTLQTAEKDGPGYAAFLDRLLEEEVGSREERRVKNALKLAGFPFLKTLDSFDFAFQPSLDRGRVMDLASLGLIARKENALLLGPPGVGKSHLAVALAVCACQNGASVYFTTLDAMIYLIARNGWVARPQTILRGRRFAQPQRQRQAVRIATAAAARDVEVSVR